MPIVRSAFVAPRWAKSPHIQTVFASQFRRPHTLDLRRERYELPDGDFVDLAWSKREAGPWVCVFHGLAGDITSPYINGVIVALEQAGFRPVFMHFRGCSGEPNRLPVTYHSGHTDDIRALVNRVVGLNDGPVHAVAYSLGANALLKFLGEEGAQCQLRSVVAVAPPLVLAVCADRMNHGLSRGYQTYLVHALRKAHVAKQQIYPHLDLPSAAGLKSFWSFDDKVTAPLNGFRGADDYYTRCSARSYLSRIAVSTLVIAAEDDPFFTPAILPNESELSDSVTLELSSHGGHVGFVSGPHPFAARFWLDQRIIERLQAA